MNYQESLEYLYGRAPMYQQKGPSAYKAGLDNMLALDELAGHPHAAYKTIHIAGTNGKGSVSHTLAAILQEAGYTVGLYTSPHLKDFTERIRVNGHPIDKRFVSNYIEAQRDNIEKIKPSFFEITTMMAFEWFRKKKVDVAVIETGLGGRLDSTNIIRPVLSIITNISLDHVKLLGNTIEKIAAEKAGIIKEGIPAVIGEADEVTRPIFEAKSPNCIFAEDFQFPDIAFELKGYCQEKNKRTIQSALEVLRLDFEIPKEAVEKGFANVVELTGLKGRWQQLGDHPTIIADTGHNEGAMQYIASQLIAADCETLRIVFGMVSDKDIAGVLALMPKHAVYYFAAADIPRAFPAQDLKNIAEAFMLNGRAYPSVKEALKAAKNDATADDFIFVGGSNFVVAEVL